MPGLELGTSCMLTKAPRHKRDNKVRGWVYGSAKLNKDSLVKEKLTADPDSEIATTSLRVSLMCPLGKMKLTVPCRAYTCTHLQCFDAALYLQMNEKKPTWTCPVCDKKAPYEALIIDGLFMEILNSVTDCDEIQFMEDGSWCPMKPKKENQEVCQPSAYSGVE
ncbi:PREDICTED: E3 SUMO-protein ligase PIAS3-like, partial [Gekko japonicus]|uniref:E3 SUMO-protein ligase PIAS3-like n=1 Tax=Gekko japonicus TaxID=146911 RepID=A0ABM1KJD0_GEKJA